MARTRKQALAFAERLAGAADTLAMFLFEVEQRPKNQRMKPTLVRAIREEIRACRKAAREVAIPTPRAR